MAPNRMRIQSLVISFEQVRSETLSMKYFEDSPNVCPYGAALCALTDVKFRGLKDNCCIHSAFESPQITILHSVPPASGKSHQSKSNG
jgi:hypothetical protein